MSTESNSSEIINVSVGDRVVHNTFPPISGTVSNMEKMLGNKIKVGVLNDETHTIYYDYIDTWDLDYTSSSNSDTYIGEYEIVSIQ